MQTQLVFVGKHDDAYRYAERTGVPKDLTFLLLAPPSPEGTARPEPEKGVSLKGLSKLMMSRTRKYGPLREFLSAQPETEASLSLSFAEIEEIINDKLPPSAHKYSAWWSDDSTHSQAWSWLAEGWKTKLCELRAQTVNFERFIHE